MPHFNSIQYILVFISFVPRGEKCGCNLWQLVMEREETQMRVAAAGLKYNAHGFWTRAYLARPRRPHRLQRRMPSAQQLDRSGHMVTPDCCYTRQHSSVAQRFLHCVWLCVLGWVPSHSISAAAKSPSSFRSITKFSCHSIGRPFPTPTPKISKRALGHMWTRIRRYCTRGALFKRDGVDIMWRRLLRFVHLPIPPYSKSSTSASASTQVSIVSSISTAMT